MLENARAESAKIMKEAEKSIANEKEKAMDDAKIPDRRPCYTGGC